MFANPTNVGISQRVVATLVACAVVLMSIGIYHTAQAANLVSVSNTLSTSEPAVTSAHSVAFTIPAASSLGNGDTVTITFPSGFTGVNNIASGDISVTVNGTPDAHAGFAQSGQQFSFNQVAATAGQEVVVAITDGNVTNPALGSYEFTVATATDTGKTRVAIVNTVLVTAIVDTSFDFTITGLATSTAINGTSTTGSTSPTLIAFGHLVANQIKTLGQQLEVVTNANNGFVVTVESDGNLESANGAIIDNFDDGSDVSVPGTAWNAPSNNITLENTWGHWGLTSNDSDRTGGAFAANNYMAASTTPRIVFDHDGPADGATQDMGQAEVAYQIQISPLQEAADDYNTTLTYIATPTF